MGMFDGVVGGALSLGGSVIGAGMANATSKEMQERAMRFEHDEALLNRTWQNAELTRNLS